MKHTEAEILHTDQLLDRLVDLRQVADTGDEPDAVVGQNRVHISHAEQESSVADPVVAEVEFEDSAVGGRLHTSPQDSFLPQPHEVQYWDCEPASCQCRVMFCLWS